MCGRYTLTADMKKVADRFGAPMPADVSRNSTRMPPGMSLGWQATCALPRYVGSISGATV